MALRLDGQLVKKKGGKPLPGFNVCTYIRGADDELVSAGYDTTDDDGSFSLEMAGSLEGPTGSTVVRFEVLDPSLVVVYETEEEIALEEPDAPATITLRVPSAPGSRKGKPALSSEDAVVAIRVVPEHAEVPLGARVVLLAEGHDENGVAVGGVGAAWRARDADGQDVPISSGGEFVARMPGMYEVVAATSAGDGAATVAVLDYDVARPSVAPTADLAADDADTGPSWNDANAASAFLPMNRLGQSASALEGTPDRPWLGVRRDALSEALTVGSANFTFSAPVLRLEGRGMDLRLDLVYNSRLWNRSEDQVEFDVDRGWPAPGWSLGFGKIVRLWGQGSMLVDADGTRHPYEVLQLTGYEAARWEFTGRTIDGTFIDYEHVDDGTGGFQWAQARYPDGTTVEYTARRHDFFEWGTGLGPSPGWGVLYPTRITDANGNVIVITYRDNIGPEIDTIVDTLGRTINFHYDQSGLLGAITGAGLDGARRTLVRLNWKRRQLEHAFAGLTAIAPKASPRVLWAIYYPGAANGYWFAEPGAYSAYGMITKVTRHRGMGFDNAPLTEPGSITPGTLTHQRSYNYPVVADSALTDVPTYTAMTEIWEGMDTAPAVTRFAALPEADPRRTEVTYANGTRAVGLAYNRPAQFDDGLIYQHDVYDGTRLLQSTTNVWKLGDYRSPRLARVETTRQPSPATVTEFDYGPHNRVTEVRELDFDGASVLRRTRTEYVADPGYLSRHILSLPSVEEVFEGAETLPTSRTEYVYDNGPLPDTPGVVGHAQSHNPYAPRVWVPPYEEQECDLDDRGHPRCITIHHPGYWQTEFDRKTRFRGNPTEIRRYADPAQRNGAVIELRTYDITGNLVAAASGRYERSVFEYSLATQYAYPDRRLSGPANPASARIVTAATYDFGTGLTVSTADANARSVATLYDPGTLRPERVTWPTGATTIFTYDDERLAVTETVRFVDGTLAGEQTDVRNGLGRLYRATSLVGISEPGGPEPRREVIDRCYDVLGRLWKETPPYWSESNPLGDELTSGPGACSWAAGRLDVFARGQHNELLHRAYDGGGWGDWESLTGDLTSDPSAVSWGPGRIDVFVRGRDNALYHRVYGAGGWGAWESLGGELTSGPGACSWAAGRLDVFARGQHNELLHRAYDGGGWGDWESLTGDLTSDPSAVSWGPGRIDVFVRGRDNALYHRVYGAGGWGAWESLGGELTSGPGACSWAAGRLDVFARGQHNELLHRAYDGGGWGDWESLTGDLTSDPSAVSWGPGRIDVFARATHDALWQKSYADGWGPDPLSTELFRDALGRVIRTRGADGSETHAYYDEPRRPDDASNPFVGQVTRLVDAWGRERWMRRNALGQLQEVVEPDPDGDGSVFSPGTAATYYTYNALGQVVGILQRQPPGRQVRDFRYDGLGRLTHQFLPERSPTLTDEGVYRRGETRWSDVLAYADASRLAWHMDARGVRTSFDYGNDPLGRLQRVTYELTSIGNPANPDPANPPAPTSPIDYEYVTAGDLSRLFRVTTYDVIEEYGYDDQGRLTSKTLYAPDRNTFALGYGYDTLDRLRSLTYPEQYPRTPGTAGKLVQLEYDLASRPRRLTVDGVAQATDITYAPHGLPAAMFIAASSRLPIAESYQYDPANGLLTGQRVLRDDGQTLLDLAYDHARPGRAGVTGQLVRTTDQLDAARSTSYEYDARARLREARGGNVDASLWTQRYTYDRFGNRTDVVASGTAPDGSAIPTDGLPALAVNLRTNRISSAGFGYDEAGNLIRSLGPDGSWRRYQHDAAGRLVRVTDDTGATLHIYLYGASRQRIQTIDEHSNSQTTYFWHRDTVIAEYDTSTLQTRLSRGLVYLGPRLLCTHTAIEHVIQNPGFEDTAKPPTQLSGQGGGDSAASFWTVWNNSDAITTTELVPTPARLGRGSQMLHVRTTGMDDGIVQTFTPSLESTNSGVWVFVLEGRVGMRTGHGGNTSAHDAESTTIGEWEHLQAPNGVSPANEFVVYSISDRGASFYVDDASVIDADPDATNPVRYHHPDRLTTRLITTPRTGEVVDLLTLPHGTALPTDLPPYARPQFTSYDRSPVTGLDYAVNRHYDPQFGRFIQPDPLGPHAIRPGQPQSNNAYSYGEGDPVNTLDPTGLIWVREPHSRTIYDGTDSTTYGSWRYRWVDDPDPDANTREDRRHEGRGEGGREGSGGDRGGWGPAAAGISWFDSNRAKQIEALMRLIKTLLGGEIQKPPPPPPPAIIRPVRPIGGGILIMFINPEVIYELFDPFNTLNWRPHRPEDDLA